MNKWSTRRIVVLSLVVAGVALGIWWVASGRLMDLLLAMHGRPGGH